MEYLTHEYARWAFVIVGVGVVAAWNLLAVRPLMRSEFAKGQMVASNSVSAEFASEPAKTRALDHVTWAHVDEFTLWQAACLWAGIEPEYPVPSGAPAAQLHRMKVSIAKHELAANLALEERASLAVHWYGGRMALTERIGDQVLLKRKDLRHYAMRMDEAPRFLLPEKT